MKNDNLNKIIIGEVRGEDALKCIQTSIFTDSKPKNLNLNGIIVGEVKGEDALKCIEIMMKS